ncbi:hypothetical protein NDU88_004298 [Pleurodeles waltl]|uniref:Secreted protein n=1 Tax=Pleurodeles waltl TaxID=8319 RepID=A0AAV7UIQ8_PLEWA|nr:hypothetical protein NDU88_004298 [Pleurodeles waltl]
MVPVLIKQSMGTLLIACVWAGVGTTAEATRHSNRKRREKETCVQWVVSEKKRKRNLRVVGCIAKERAASLVQRRSLVRLLYCRQTTSEE